VGSFQADGLAARTRLEGEGALEDAFNALDEGDLRDALDKLLSGLTSTNGQREEIRKVIVGELDALGADDPVARDARRRLASALY
jgi:putative thioredoxin